MIRIKDISLREIHLPLKEPFRISSGVETVRRILLLHVRTHNGLETWSECVAGALPNYSSEAIDTAWVAIREWIAPRVLAKEFETPEEVYLALERDFRGHNMAKAAVEMAAWDLTAQAQSMPLSKLLGGTRKEIATGISLGIQESPQALVKKVDESLSLGYKKAKIKVKPGQDIEFVAAVREALGPDAPIMVDANNAYTLDDLETLRQLDAFGLMMIEQPLAWDDILRHATLQKELKTPICLDESITSLEKAEEMVALGSGRIVNIKPGRVGGFTQAVRIHDFCLENKIPVWCGGMLESGVGRAYNVALASLPNFVLPGDVSPSSRYWQEDVVTPEWRMSEDGMVQVPLAAPGMGVSVNIDRVENLTKRLEQLT